MWCIFFVFIQQCRVLRNCSGLSTSTRGFRTGPTIRMCWITYRTLPLLKQYSYRYVLMCWCVHCIILCLLCTHVIAQSQKNNTLILLGESRVSRRRISAPDILLLYCNIFFANGLLWLLATSNSVTWSKSMGEKQVFTVKCVYNQNKLLT